MAFKLVQDKSDSDDYPNSYYHASCNRSVELTPLDGSRRADVCIVGAGYTGLSSALHLAQHGYDCDLKPGIAHPNHKPGYAQGYSGQGVAMATLAGKLIAEAIAGEAERFDLFGKIPTRSFPGGDLLRWPTMVLGMSYYALRDRL